MAGLASHGRLVLLGAGQVPLALPAGHLRVGERSVLGSITGTPLRERESARLQCSERCPPLD
jgi:alcohol dehydrogenase